MKCKRCDVDECRINGFCSPECEEISDLLTRIAELEAMAKKDDWYAINQDVIDDQRKQIDVLEAILSQAKEARTCVGCAQIPLCQWAWDGYNTNGKCLAAK